ncbi:DUF5343 domain-containing protein [Amycolatopsis panacis]|uniref:DUF5343 domain-containing protein n=1 Tax=Amycolatopsis panacis TaxID=2340917 RepID=UPI0011C45230|nr:DUF5343 domain-containing protein [Amycolatopsis panacis]
MASIQFTFSYSPGKLEEFIKKLQTVGAPEKISSEYPKSIGFGSSHARSFPAALKYAGLLDSSGQPTEVYKKGLRGGSQGRVLVSKAIMQAYKPMFDTYPDANNHSDSDLVTFVKSHSDFDEDKSRLVVRTFKVLCKFGEFTATGDDGQDDDGDDGDDSNPKGDAPRRRHRDNSGGAVVINVNIALSVDATSDAAVYDAFFAAMAKHLKGLMDGSS